MDGEGTRAGIGAGWGHSNRLPELYRFVVYSGSPAASVTEQSRTMKLLAYLLIALALGYALAVFLDPSFPDLLEIIDNPKF